MNWAKSLIRTTAAPRCETCINFVRGHGPDYYISFDELKEACQFCQLLRSMASHFAGLGPIESVGITSLHVQHRADQPVSISFRFLEASAVEEGDSTASDGDSTASDGDSTASDGDSSASDGDSTASDGDSTASDGDSFNSDLGEQVEFLVYCERQCPLLPSLGVLKPFVTGVDLDGSVAFVQKHITHCLRTHDDCAKATAARLPARIISLGATSSRVVRLVQTEGNQAPHVTLSHCWGGSQPLRTTQSNIADMLVSISYESLPVVFQQAILFARKLKIGYIWIDSLCIIQDSREDWEIESAKMSEYYENAFLNICTASSPSHDVPFLGKRDPFWCPAKFRLRGGMGRRYDIWARRLPRFNSITDSGVLFSRAWAWQEAALAARTVYFTTTELIWECPREVIHQQHVLDVNISGAIGFSSDLSSLKSALAEQMEHRLQGGSPGTTAALSRVEPHRIWDRWNVLVTAYSMRRLTYDTDRFPAFSGVARRVKEGTEGRYLAGLLEQNFAANLCWELYIQTTNDILEYEYPEYIAPTWSWASISQPVQYDAGTAIRTFYSHVTVLDVRCEVPGLNPFGRVSGAHLLIRGKVIQIRIHCEDNLRQRKYYSVGNGENWRFTPDCVLDEANGRLVRAAKTKVPSLFSIDVPFLYLGEYRHDDQVEGAGVHYALGLGRSNLQDGAFCRVGLAWCIRSGPDLAVAEQSVLIL